MRTKSIKRILAILLSLVMVLALAACGGSTKTDENSAGTTKFLNLGTSFAYPSLDTHKEYYGWYTSIYGITESLFKIGD